MRKYYLPALLVVILFIWGVVFYYLITLFSVMGILPGKESSLAIPTITKQEQSYFSGTASSYKQIFNMPGWQSEYLSPTQGGIGATFVNETSDAFMLVLKNQNPASYLRIGDNSQIAIKFSLGEPELKTEKLGNFRFGLRLFSASSTTESNKDNIYSELGFFRDYQRKKIGVEYFNQKPQASDVSGKLKIVIPWETQKVEIMAIPFQGEKTRVKVTDTFSGKILGDELVDLVLFPKESFMNTKIELGNQINKINIDSLEIFCTKCIEVL